MPPAPAGHSWESLMAHALERARMAAALGEIPVGAVLVAPDGRVLAAEGNAPVALHDPTAHAEIQVLRRAGPAFGNYRLGGCVLVVTLEPCAMCAAAAIHARLAGVVYGAADPQAGAVVSCAEYFDAQSANHSIWHMGGIRAAECAQLLHDFFATRRNEQG
ncbi:MAG: tRNA adenosine(34) deaminase TadA [Desulfovibrio sp.]|nr:tRNA adenosine(34) deaminase TadA [Desulfovibrio sp.]